ncbi:MAG TPA: AMP-binding protein, partial [Solirubrobacteraceae bacterium]
MSEIAAWLPRAAASDPQRVALETPAGALTYAELDARARIAAGRLAALGAAAGDRVALRMEPGIGFVETFWGCLLLG